MTATKHNALQALVVDDDTFLLELLTTALASFGVEVATATDGESALQALDQLQGDVDLLVCDLNMPGMDGIQFLRQLGQRKFGGSVVVVSGEDKRILKTTENLAREHNLHLLGAVAKPVTRNALAEILSQMGNTPIKAAKSPEQISEEDLQKGLRDGRITAFFQPKVEISTRKVLGVETLARWNRPGQGLVGPGAFIATAENCGMIDSLTDAVLLAAMKQARRWCAEGLDLKVAVNISVDSLHRLDLPEQILSQAAQQGIQNSQIILEVTETRLMRNIASVLEVLTRLRLKGVALSLDDFGTGYSTLEQLKRIPFDELKIDRAFVNGAAHDSAARAILEWSVRLGRELGMRVVAEGVENQEEWDLAARLGCDLVQGYFVAKPMPGEQLRRWIGGWYLDGTAAKSAQEE